jgi:D-alanyl-D-alanine carboxypeptidase
VKSTEKKTKKKKSLLNRMLAAVTVGVICLSAVFGVMLYRQSRYMDLSRPYSPEAGAEEDRTGVFSLQAAPAFASELCVSDGSIVREGVSFPDPSEKALLFRLDTGEALFAQGIYDQVYPASITKIMTAILAARYGDMEDQVIMEESDFALEEGSQVSGLKPGDLVTMDQLFHALVVHSANDAAMAIARHIGGSVEQFVDMMNEEALELGMTGTHFANPHGLHDPDHYTTAYDVYLMLNEAFRYSAFTEAAQMPFYQLDVDRPDGSRISLQLDSTDQYMTGAVTAPRDVTLLCGKTGTTDQAGSCLALIAQNAYGVPYIAVILHAGNHASLYQDMNVLLEQINS